MQAQAGQLQNWKSRAQNSPAKLARDLSEFMPKITFKLPSGDETIEVADGTTVFDAAAMLGVDTGGVCGQGACGLCRIRVVAGADSLNAMTDAEEMHLGNISDERLSCQCMPGADAAVELLG